MAELLKDIPYEILNLAIQKYMMSEVSPYYENLCDTNPFNDERFGG